MSNRNFTFSFPNADDREWRKINASSQVLKQSSAPSKYQSHGYVFGARECLSIPLWVNSCDPTAIEKIAGFELESLLGEPVNPEKIELSIIESDLENKQTLVRLTVIPDSIDESIVPLSGCLTRLQISPNFYQAQKDAIHIWFEMKGLVVSFSKGEKIVHWYAINGSEVNRNTLSDIHCVWQDLLVRNICGRIETIVLFGMVGDKFTDLIKEIEIPHLRIVHFDGIPSAEFSGGKYEPPKLVECKQNNRKKLMRYVYGFICVFVLLSVFALLVLDLKKQQRELDDLVAINDSLRPKAEGIAKIQERWAVLEPAINQDKFPIEIFHQVFSLLPSSGIRLTELSLTDEKLLVKAQASSVSLAIKFKADLESQDSLSVYTWSIPQPTIKGQQASFIAVGIKGE